MSTIREQAAKLVAELLRETDAEFPGHPDIEFAVTASKDGKFVEMPNVLTNYRHPNPEEIDALRKKSRERTDIWAIHRYARRQSGHDSPR